MILLVKSLKGRGIHGCDDARCTISYDGRDRSTGLPVLNAPLLPPDYIEDHGDGTATHKLVDGA